MTELDRKLAILASLTGKDPLPSKYKSSGLNCDGIYCSRCPFGDERESCDEPKRTSAYLRNATIRTYKDALDNYPEYFL